jgi:hypothetical protein
VRNPALTNLAGLSGLVEVAPDRLSIHDNASLPACWAWQLNQQLGTSCNEYSCDGNTGTGSCGTLPADFVCEPGAVGPGVYDGDVYLEDGWMSATIEEYGGVTCVTGHLVIWQQDIADLSRLSTLQMVGGDFGIDENPNLTQVDGLGNLTSVGGLHIGGNPALTNLAGLSNLSDVDTGPAYITNNASLPACWAELINVQVGYACNEYSYVGNTGTGTCDPP